MTVLTRGYVETLGAEFTHGRQLAPSVFARHRFSGLEVVEAKGGTLYRPRVRVREPDGRTRTVRLYAGPHPLFAAIQADVARMILGRKPRNFSRETFAAMRQERVAHTWAVTVEAIVAAVGPEMATALAGQPNPFRPEEPIRTSRTLH